MEKLTHLEQLGQGLHLVGVNHPVGGLQLMHINTELRIMLCNNSTARVRCMWNRDNDRSSDGGSSSVGFAGNKTTIVSL